VCHWVLSEDEIRVTQKPPSVCNKKCNETKIDIPFRSNAFRGVMFLGVMRFVEQCVLRSIFLGVMHFEE
jgi:hypothetical protein